MFFNTTFKKSGEGRYDEINGGRIRCAMAKREGEAEFKYTETVRWEWRDTSSSAESKVGSNSGDG